MCGVWGEGGSNPAQPFLKIFIFPCKALRRVLPEGGGEGGGGRGGGDRGTVELKILH